MKDLTTSEFDAAIASGIAVIDFWASWCGPCKMLTPILEELSNEMEDISFYKVNADENSVLIDDFGIRSIPTVIIFNNGEPIASQAGAFPKVKMRKFIEDAVASVL